MLLWGECGGPVHTALNSWRKRHDINLINKQCIMLYVWGWVNGTIRVFRGCFLTLYQWSLGSLWVTFQQTLDLPKNVALKSVVLLFPDRNGAATDWAQRMLAAVAQLISKVMGLGRLLCNPRKGNCSFTAVTSAIPLSVPRDTYSARHCSTVIAINYLKYSTMFYWKVKVKEAAGEHICSQPWIHNL